VVGAFLRVIAAARAAQAGSPPAVFVGQAHRLAGQLVQVRDGTDLVPCWIRSRRAMITEDRHPPVFRHFCSRSTPALTAT